MAEPAEIPGRSGGPGTRTVYLVDPDLRGAGGHYLDYALAIYHEARRRGDRFLAFVPSDADEAVRGALPTETAFERRHKNLANDGSPLHSLRMAANLVRESRAAYAELRRATRRLPAAPSVFFFPNPSSVDILGYAAWMLRQPRGADVSFVVMLRWDHHIRGRRGVHRALIKAAYALARRGHPAARFTSDSVPLARSYSELLDAPVEVLPIPHTPHDAPRRHPGAPGVAAGRPLRVAYVGGWRGEQGVGDLADALAALRPELERGELAATVQANPPKHDPEGCASRDRLRSAALPNVEILGETLSRERFLECFDQADVILIPYDSDIYRYRTSGIFAEAVALGKPVITTRGSWMAGELGGDEALLFESGSPEDLACAIRGAAARLPELQASAARRQAAWNEFHNPASFYDRLVAPGRAGLAPVPAHGRDHELPSG